MFEPMKVTAYPMCGIITDCHLPLDSLLFYSAMRDAYGPEITTRPGQYTAEPVPIPLATAEFENEWVYCASFADWSQAAHCDFSSFWTKRFDPQNSRLIDFGGKTGKVVVENGRYKSYHMPTFHRHALSVCWYAVGDIDGVRQLLSHLTHIGKKTAAGNGRITRWEVSPMADDHSIYKNGELMRSIPCADGGVYWGVRPSYWKNKAMCKLP